MGQYYKPCCLSEDKKEVISWLYSHDYDNGLKLMEHSWIGNDFVGAIEALLTKDGSWHKKPIVWAGDYAKKENGIDYNLYDLCKDYNKHKTPVKALNNRTTRYIINHDKKLYVDKTHLPIEHTYTNQKTGKNDLWYIHPLPLLTSEGNGQGGGDFMGDDDGQLVGSWARDRISVSSMKPNNEYSELLIYFTEKE